MGPGSTVEGCQGERCEAGGKPYGAERVEWGEESSSEGAVHPFSDSDCRNEGDGWARLTSDVLT